MKKITLNIKNPYERETVVLENEISIGRTDAAQVVLSDTGLSRKNTSFFRDGDVCFVVDENSLNGTFVNGGKVSGAPQQVFDGDEITLGTETRIAVEIAENRESRVETKPLPSAGDKPKAKSREPKNKNQKSKTSQPPVILMVAGGSAVLILVLGVVALIVANSLGTDNKNVKPTPQTIASAVIPVRVIDPLGGEDPDDINDLVKSWEVQEEPLKAADIEEINTVTSSKETPNVPKDLAVTKEFWQAQMNKARNHVGVNEPLVPQLGGGIGKQQKKLKEMIDSKVYKQPLDFADLAEQHLKGVLVELPLATETYVLDVGGSAGDDEFKSFEWGADGSPVVGTIMPGTPKYQILQQVANDFYGQKYDLNVASDRKKMRMRLLRMFNPKSRILLEELCKAYHARFNAPLILSSLIRSVDYQLLLGKSNKFAFKITAQNAYSPHTSGCAFDTPLSSISNGEENFLTAKLLELENAQRLDAIVENKNCFHVFIYSDGVPPGQQTSKQPPTTKPPTTKPKK